MTPASQTSGSSDLEAFPDSVRIQRAAQEMAGAIDRAVAIGAPKIHPIEVIEARDYELAAVDPDPANMSRLKVTKPPREIDRPPSTWEAFERITPQFFLRNTHRIERYADQSLYEYTRVSDGRASLARIQALVEAARAASAGDVTAPLSSAEVHAARAERAVLMVATPWSDHFGRPDPQADATD